MTHEVPYVKELRKRSNVALGVEAINLLECNFWPSLGYSYEVSLRFKFDPFNSGQFQCSSLIVLCN